jgi:hypothetical protein
VLDVVSQKNSLAPYLYAVDVVALAIVHPLVIVKDSTGGNIKSHIRKRQQQRRRRKRREESEDSAPATCNSVK